MKKFIAITLAVLVMMSAVVCSFSVSAASNATITYSFSGDEKSIAGFAEGTISVKNNTSSTATYYLYWADDTKALDGYRQIATLSVAAGATGTYTMLDHTAIPPKATQLIAIQSSSTPSNKNVSNAAGTYAIPAGKKLTDTTTLYTFGAFSDPQIANDSYGSNSYPHDETHWAKALETFTQRDVDFLVSSGDIVNDQNGSQTYAAEYQRYQKILADSSYCGPVYESNGNHDVATVWNKNGGYYNNDTPFIKGTGLDSDINTIKAGKPYFEITEPITGDHFIFMALEGGFYTDRGTQFSTAQLDWLEGLLKKYKNDGKNIFILEHANVQGWGSGDKLTTPYYYDLGLNPNSADVKRFVSLMETYKECVIITGHTHLELGAHLNYSDNNGSSAVMMHNSAIGGVRRLVNGVIDRSAVLGMCEGYFVDVYEDCIIFNGANLYYNEIMPDCTYIIPFDTTANGEIPTEEPTEKPNPTETQTPTSKPTETTAPTQAPTDAGEVTEGYYLVGTLNGKSLWSADTLTADRKLYANPDVSGEYFLPWTFYGGDELKIAHFNGTGIDQWFNDGGDNYKIGATSNKVGDTTIFFRPAGNSSWSYEWFTVQPRSSTDPTIPPTEKPTEAPTEKPTEKPTEAPTVKPTEEPTEEPTEKPTEKPTEEPTEKPTEEPTEKPTQEPTKPSWFLYGDVNLDGMVAVIDATCIQRKVAQLDELYDEQLINADVDGDDIITVIDATYIQRKVAKMIDKFPVEEVAAKVVAVTGASDVATLLATAKADLSKYYTFSSFDQYQAVKKLVKQLQTSGDTSQTAYNKLNSAYTDFVEILEAMGTATGDTIDVYFTNNLNWTTVNVYVWNSAGAKVAWPGEAMTYVETNSMSQKVYKITLETGKYTNIIFNNGSAQTVDLTLSNTNNEGFYTTTQSGGKYLCETYVYGE